MVEITNLNNLINLGLKFNKKYIKFKKSRIICSYVQVLIDLNIIKFIKIDIKKNLYLYLNINYNSNSIKLLNLYKPSQKKTIKLKNLRAKNLNKIYLFLISSQKGISFSEFSGLLLSSIIF